jgi:glycerophosphoryl diester phosphodiesterase
VLNLRKQRLATAAVVGAVVTGVSALTVAAPPLLRHASAEAETPGRPAPAGAATATGRPSAPEPAVARLEPAPPGIQPDPPPAGPTTPNQAAPGVALPGPAAPQGLHGRPLIIGHRGASAYRAEETLDSYRLAIAEGADYIEADLVLTSDDALVARHENELSATTDVAQHPEFANRRRTKVVGGVQVTGWFTEDFTLAELRTLRAVSRTYQPKPSSGVIPTLQEIIDLARSQSHPVGLYLELKTPAYFTALGLAPEPRLVDALQRNRLTGSGVRVYVESFDADSLRTVHRLVDVPEIQLVGGANPADAAVQRDGLAQIRQYAVGIGIDRARLGLDGPAAANLVNAAHVDRLEVHVFTFGPDAEVTYRRLYDLGIDGVFTDNPDLALAARRHAYPPPPIHKPE